MYNQTKGNKMIIFGVYKNSDMTEGRGPMVLDKLFANENDAIKYRESQLGVMGRPLHLQDSGDWCIKTLEVTDKVVEVEKVFRLDETGENPEWYNLYEAKNELEFITKFLDTWPVEKSLTITRDV